MALPSIIHTAATATYINGKHPVCKSSGGDIYTFSRSPSASGYLAAYKADNQDPGTTWTEVDSGNRLGPIHTTDHCVTGYQVGDTVHFAYYKGSSVELYYNTFNLAAGTWGTAELVYSQGDIGEKRATLSVRSNGDIVIFHTSEQTRSKGSGYYRVGVSYKTGGSWTANVQVDADSTFNYTNPAIVKSPGSDDMHLFWVSTLSKSATARENVHVRTFRADNTLSTTQSLNYPGAQFGTMSARESVAIDDSGTARMFFAASDVTASDYVLFRAEEDGNGDAVFSATPKTIIAHWVNGGYDPLVSNYSTDLCMGLHGTDLHFLLVDSLDKDIWHTSSTDMGATFPDPTEILHEAGESFWPLFGNIISRGGNIVFAYTYNRQIDDEQAYNEYFIAVDGGGPTPVSQDHVIPIDINDTTALTSDAVIPVDYTATPGVVTQDFVFAVQNSADVAIDHPVLIDLNDTTALTVDHVAPVAFSSSLMSDSSTLPEWALAVASNALLGVDYQDTTGPAGDTTRLTQAYAEVLVQTAQPTLRSTQSYAEVLVQTAQPTLRTTQVYAEVLVKESPTSVVDADHAMCWEQQTMVSAPGASTLADTILLLHFDGEDQSTTVIDSSADGRVMTVSGNAKISTAQGKFGQSLYVDGTVGSKVTTPYVKAEMDWWTQDFTIECFVQAASWPGWSSMGHSNLIGNMGSNNFNYWSFGPDGNGKAVFYYFNGGGIHVLSTSTLPVDTMNHIAMTHSGGKIRIFVNGTLETTVDVSGTPQTSETYPLQIGEYNGSVGTGYVDELRIVVGTAVYTENFTPPTQPFGTPPGMPVGWQTGGIFDHIVLTDWRAAAASGVDSDALLPVAWSSDLNVTALAYADWLAALHIDAAMVAEYLQGIRLTPVAPVDWQVGALKDATVAPEWRSTGGMDADALFPVNWGGVTQADANILADWQGSLQHDSLIPVAHMAAVNGTAILTPVWQGSLLADNGLLLEWTVTLRHDQTIPLGHMVSLSLQQAIEVEYGLGLGVTPEILVSWLTGGQTDAQWLVEWLTPGAMTSDADVPVEWQATAAALTSDHPIPVSWLALLEGDETLHVEVKGTLLRDSVMPAEMQGGTAIDINVTVGWSGYIDCDSDLLLSWSGWATIDHQLTAEWLRGFAGVDHSIPVYWLQGVTEVLTAAVSWHYGVALDNGIPLETVSKVNIGAVMAPMWWQHVRSDQQVPTEYRATMAMDLGPVWYEWDVWPVAYIADAVPVEWTQEVSRTDTSLIRWNRSAVLDKVILIDYFVPLTRGEFEALLGFYPALGGESTAMVAYGGTVEPGGAAFKAKATSHPAMHGTPDQMPVLRANTPNIGDEDDA